MPLDTSLAILNVDDILQELGATEDDYLKVERLLNAASDRLERFCNTKFKKRSAITLTLNGNGQALLDLGAPILSVTSVTIEDQVVPATDYKVLATRGQLYYENTWPIGVQNIVVACSLGYDPVPHPITEACMFLVREWFERPSTEYQSEKIGDYSYTRSDRVRRPLEDQDPDLPMVVKSLALPFRRWSFA